ncbi:zinc finger protein 577-like [Pollicipes pollicipes]|uniref:zinc finger protein 577-like n=1 Tax=Pollicipes pollicipes TaxID=41117 RepID=UPI0018853F4E|nr:zinc finger protein 577-like [Pollicipes pollicipes]
MPSTVFLMNAKGFSSAWPELVQQVAAAVLESAGIAPRTAFRRQAARARDLEETLSILSVADTASLLDRTETLSVFSDTADLSTLADDNWTSLELAGGGEPETPARAGRDRPHEAPSVSFAEPSAGDRMPGRKTADKGEDLLREFAETMSNISEGVVLEDLEGYFEELDRPCHGGGVVVAGAHRTLHTDRAATCELCGKLFDRKDTMLKTRETHKTNNEHGCALCGKMYKQRRILAKHMRLIHA